jgi:hypothetical protein
MASMAAERTSAHSACPIALTVDRVIGHVASAHVQMTRHNPSTYCRTRQGVEARAVHEHGAKPSTPPSLAQCPCGHARAPRKAQGARSSATGGYRRRWWVSPPQGRTRPTPRRRRPRLPRQPAGRGRTAVRRRPQTVPPGQPRRDVVGSCRENQTRRPNTNLT